MSAPKPNERPVAMRAVKPRNGVAPVEAALRAACEALEESTRQINTLADRINEGWTDGSD